ncbi:SPFH domain-containing protein [Flavobacterium subsaxonicum]|uniref:Virion core protein (Lumpy skin disease virus) n=1 Tax=Flavobacterium subsaxonicum WB 4.1-42 = DSM 21790 TaxID=1121898 RepID=A0A0A2MN62_9FLAO|nr:SPFH domain-containing protein [Flavobacterium subsaxonicum]KGO93744.1 virion core protein (lumpy skin disease virus) [Flavobacterium subsaxonicum WB 4.1-42 = DSM 21790]
MGILNFFSGNEGGFMDVISCNQKDYLVHKWSPNGEPNTTSKENAIRYGSTLRVNAGEAAILFYDQKNGNAFDIITGPADQTIKTANLPILTNIVGAAYGGDSPFMAQVYFFNLQQNNQIKFGIPYFDVFDNRFPDLGVPCAVRGSLTFNITNIANFIKLYRLVNFELSDFKDQIEDFFTRKIKSIVLNIPAETGLPVMQLERRLDDINTYLQAKLATDLELDFGINLKRIDINAIELDDTDANYRQLKGATVDQQTRFTGAKTDVEITNMGDLARIQRKDIEMGVEGKNFTVHQVDLQADILKTAANNLGAMGNINLGNGGGFSPLGIATGMAVGGAMGNQMGGMMGNITNTPPPPPAITWHIALNGQQSGPYTVAQLQEFALSGQFTPDHFVWKQGMQNWEAASAAAGVSQVFAQVPPPPPPPPGADAATAKTSKINLTKKQ